MTTGRPRRPRLRHPPRPAPRQGHRRGRGRGSRQGDQRAADRSPRWPTSSRERTVGGSDRAAHPGGRTRFAGRATPQAAVAVAGGGRRARVTARHQEAGRPLDLRLPPTEAPDLPPPTELERLGDAYAILSLDARRQVIELFRPALDQLGVITSWRAGRCAARTHQDRWARGHAPAPDDGARHGLPGTRGRDRHGQRHSLAGHLGTFPTNGAPPRAALRGGAARAGVERGQRDRRPGRIAPEMARPPAARRSPRASATWATPV